MNKHFELEAGLASLSVVPPKSKKSGLVVLSDLCTKYLETCKDPPKSKLDELDESCTRHLAHLNFDSTSILDTYLNHRGEIINEKDRKTAGELAAEILTQIVNKVTAVCDHSQSEESKVEEVDSTPNLDLSPSEVVEISDDDETSPSVLCPWIPFKISGISTGSELGSQNGVAQDAECQVIVQNLDKKFNSLNVLISWMTALTITFGMTLKTVAKSGKFDVIVVKSLLEEFEIFLNLMLSQEDTEDLPESWKFLLELAILQNQVFDFYMDANDYERAHFLLWILCNNTDMQKNFLKRCINESVGFKDVMSEVGAAIDSMLFLQEEFILKLIARLQESKAVQVSNLPNSMEC